MYRILDILSGILFGTISLSITALVSFLIYLTIPIFIVMLIAFSAALFGIFLSFHIFKSIVDVGWKLFFKSIVNPPHGGVFYINKLNNVK